MTESARYCDACGNPLEAHQARFCSEMCRVTYNEVFRSAPDDESWDEEDEQITSEEWGEAELSGDYTHRWLEGSVSNGVLGNVLPFDSAFSNAAPDGARQENLAREESAPSSRFDGEEDEDLDEDFDDDLDDDDLDDDDLDDDDLDDEGLDDEDDLALDLDSASRVDSVIAAEIRKLSESPNIVHKPHPNPVVRSQLPPPSWNAVDENEPLDDPLTRFSKVLGRQAELREQQARIAAQGEVVPEMLDRLPWYYHNPTRGGPAFAPINSSVPQPSPVGALHCDERVLPMEQFVGVEVVYSSIKYHEQPNGIFEIEVIAQLKAFSDKGTSEEGPLQLTAVASDGCENVFGLASTAIPSRTAFPPLVIAAVRLSLVALPRRVRIYPEPRVN